MMEHNPKPISLVLVVHQEAGTIERVIQEFYEKVVSKIPNSEILICEDGSTDGTKEILLRIQNQYNLVLDMKNEKRGYTGAMRDGFEKAKNEVIFFSDSDGQHDPNDFWEMYPLLQQADMVIGWKKKRKDAWYRLLISWVFNKLISIYFNVDLHDINCGFRLIKKQAAEAVLRQEWILKYCISAEVTVRMKALGYNVAEVPVNHYNRQFGESRGLPFKKLPSAISHILKEFPRIKKDINKQSM